MRSKSIVFLTFYFAYEEEKSCLTLPKAYDFILVSSESVMRVKVRSSMR
ncbi:hypothetical protein EVA_08259 [gut metagenome]|uniref:Uncharacterized protein n=1 Tax=gut metagenome TaxID=749906 RepID=J9GTH6_9ZZZZ